MSKVIYNIGKRAFVSLVEIDGVVQHLEPNRSIELPDEQADNLLAKYGKELISAEQFGARSGSTATDLAAREAEVAAREAAVAEKEAELEKKAPKKAKVEDKE